MGRLSPADFHTVYGFRRPNMAPGGLMPGLRSGLSLHPPPASQGLGAARLVSTPSRLEYITGLGSGLPNKVSPNLSSSASLVSQPSTQVFLKSAAYAIPPRPRAAVLLMIGHVARFYTSVSLSRVGLYSYGEKLARFVDADLDSDCHRRATSYRVSHRHVSGIVEDRSLGIASHDFLTGLVH